MDSKDKNAEIVEMVQYIYSQYFDNEKHVENLHEMFVCFVNSEPRHQDFKDGIISTYQSLRQFLRDSEKILNA